MMAINSLYCPFPSKIHPEAAAVQDRSVAWAQSLGLIATEQHVRAAHDARHGWLMARAFPRVTLRALQLVTDWTLVFFALDDHVEEVGTAGEVAVYLEYLLDVFRGAAGPFDDPFARAMIDLRARALALGSRSQIARFAGALEDLFAGFVAEAHHRDHARIPDVASYVRLREVTIGLHAILPLAELVGSFQLSGRVRDHAAVRRLATRASNIVGWANDLYTCEKEIAQGEIHNLVLVLRRERHLTLADAAGEVVAMHDREVKGFVREAAELPALGADPKVGRYVEMLMCWIRGHLDWARETGHYRPSDAHAAPSAGVAAAA